MSESAAPPDAARARIAAWTCSRRTDRTDERPSNSAAIVSAMPAPIQSSAGAPLMLTNCVTANPAGESPWAATQTGASQPTRTANAKRIEEECCMDR